MHPGPALWPDCTPGQTLTSNTGILLLANGYGGGSNLWHKHHWSNLKKMSLAFLISYLFIFYFFYCLSKYCSPILYYVLNILL